MASTGRRALLLTTSLALVAAACGDDGDALEGAFYLEARYEVTNPSEGTTVSELRWWYEPEGRFRWEIAPEGDESDVVGVSDGETWTAYDGDAKNVRPATAAHRVRPAGASGQHAARPGARRTMSTRCWRNSSSALAASRG